LKVLNTDNYNNFDSELPLHANHAEALKKAREVEKNPEVLLGFS